MHIISISVKPFVYKYVLARYQFKTAWKIDKQERIGKVVYSMLEWAPLRHEKTKTKLGADLLVEICEHYVQHKGVHISNKSALEFNDYIQMEIIEEIAMLIWHVKNRTGLKPYRELYVRHNRTKKSKVTVVRDPNLFQYLEEKQVIYDILKRYDISEGDLPFETVRKSVQRLKLPLLVA